MAILTLLLATRHGCRWLGTCQRFVNLDSQCWLFLGSAKHFPFSPKGVSSRLVEARQVAGIAPSMQTSGSPITAKVVSEGNTSRLQTDGKVQVSLRLRRLFNFNAEEANRLVRSYEGFTMIDAADVTLNYDVCIEAGFDSVVVKKNPGILAYPHEIMMKKIKFIRRMQIANINDAVSFVYLGLTKLRVFSLTMEQESLENGGINRIKYLSEQLEGRTFDICNIIARHHFMQTITYSRLVLNLKIMLDHHVSKEDILNDIWAFRYRPEVIMERLKRVVDAGVFPVKTWMIRCSENCLSRRIGKELLRHSVLGNNGTTIEYLSKRLNCEKSRLEVILARNPNLMHVSGPKMKSVIDFLMENGYTNEQLVHTPRVLLRKVETMQERLDELAKYGHKPTSVSVLCKSQLEFDKYLKGVKQGWIKKDGKQTES